MEADGLHKLQIVSFYLEQLLSEMGFIELSKFSEGQFTEVRKEYFPFPLDLILHVYHLKGRILCSNSIKLHLLPPALSERYREHAERRRGPAKHLQGVAVVAVSA